MSFLGRGHKGHSGVRLSWKPALGEASCRLVSRGPHGMKPRTPANDKNPGLLLTAMRATLKEPLAPVEPSEDAAQPISGLKPPQRPPSQSRSGHFQIPNAQHL